MKKNYKKNKNRHKTSNFFSLLIIFFLLPVLFSSVSVYSASYSGEKNTGLLQQAQSFHKQQCFNEAAVLYHEAVSSTTKSLGPDHPEVGMALSGLASLKYDKGEYEQAGELYERVHDINEKFYGPRHIETAKGLNNLAMTCLALGEYSQALTFCKHSLVIYKTFHGSDHPLVARGLNNLAEVYKLLGESLRAKDFLERSLDITESIYGPDHAETSAVLNNLAGVSKITGEYSRAKHFYDRALTISEKANGPNHNETATVLNNFAGLCFYLGDYKEAKNLYERALKIDEKIYGNNHPDVAVRLNNLAEIYYHSGNYSRALPFYERALVIAQESSFLELIWRTQFNIACLLEKKKSAAPAVFFGKQAVNTIQSMRSGIKDMDLSLRRSFLKDKMNVYRFLADLLIDEGRLLEAQQVLDLQKDEEYFDFIKRDGVRNSGISYTSEEEYLAERYRKINQRIAAFGKEMAELENRKKRSLTKAEKKRYAVLKKDLKVAKQSFTKYLSDLIEELGDAAIERYADIRKKRLEKPGKLQQKLRDLGQGVAAVHYLISGDKLRIILTTGEVQLARDSNISAKELNRKIMNYRKILQRPRLSPFKMAMELYRIVIGPIEKDLQQAGSKTLMLCLDGALRYLPVAALHDGEVYVTEKYQIAVYTAAAGLNIEDYTSRQWEVAGFGLSRAVNGFEPLTGVESELEGIVIKNKNDPDGVLPGVIYLNDAFTSHRVKSVLEKKYPVMHIASHFELNPGAAESSYLVLGDGMELTLAQIQADEYDFNGLEMLSLSACNTAVGMSGANGSEIESFGALAQNKGAKSVLATLWSVSDKSTGGFMQNLYRLHEHENGMTTAAALRNAQMLFINGTKKDDASMKNLQMAGLSVEGKKKIIEEVTFTPDPEASYAHPYYWAPFVLMGSWL